jgi:hypothetical protein
VSTAAAFTHSSVVERMGNEYVGFTAVAMTLSLPGPEANEKIELSCLFAFIGSRGFSRFLADPERFNGFCYLKI